MKKILLTLSITFLLLLNSFGQTPDILAKSFLDDMQSRGFESALKYAPKDSLMSQQTRIDKLNQQFKNQKTKLGKYYGYEEIKNEDNKIECFVIKSFILKYENSPAQLNLVFYKPNDKWLLHNVAAKRFSNNKRNRK